MPIISNLFVELMFRYNKKRAQQLNPYLTGQHLFRAFQLGIPLKFRNQRNLNPVLK